MIPSFLPPSFGCGSAALRSSVSHQVFSFSLLHRQHDMRWAVRVVVDGLVGEVVALLQAKGAAGVGVNVEPGPVAAADVQADAMPFLKILDVGYSWKTNSQGFPGSRSSGFSKPFRYRARRMESVRLMANPSG